MVQDNRTRNARIHIQHKGDLSHFGYHGVKDLTLAARRRALRAAAKVWGWLHLLRKLNALYVFNMHRNPDVAAIFHADQQYASWHHKRDRAACNDRV